MSVQLTHTGAQLDSAISKVQNDYADVSGVTAVAGDVAQGKYFVTSAGVLTEGTASGGGGGSVEDIGVIEFMFQSSQSCTLHVLYDSTIGNSACADEDGNEYTGGNGEFQMVVGAVGNNWVSLATGTQSLSANAVYRFRFVNTDTNKPFIFKGTQSAFTGNDGSTELWISGASNVRFGPNTYDFVETTGSPTTTLWNSYNATIGLSYAFDWIICYDVD